MENLASLIIKDFNLEINNEIQEKELFDILANEVAYLLENRLEYFFNILYRLDIDEKKVEKALSLNSDRPPNIEIATLIIEREKARIRTREMYKR